MFCVTIFFLNILSHSRGVLMETLSLSLEELGKLFVTAFPVGFLIGCIPMIIGVCIHGIVSIFKKV